MEEEKMTQEKINEKLNGFFRFYEDGFEETRPAYEKIIGAFVKSGVLPEGTTLDAVIEKCKEIDAAEVVRTGGKVKEANIGLQGYFASLGISESAMKDVNKARELYEKFGLDPSKMPEKAEDRLKAINMAMGENARKAFNETEIEGGKREQATIEASAFLGSLAAGPYFPRQTCFSASHFMSEGSIMQIGCSQGKTSVVAMTTYEQLMAGKKVFSTSSAPGLVPENYNEAKAFYEKMGIAEQFCAISQNMETKKDHIVLFHDEQGLGTTSKYEITSDGKILVHQKEFNEEKREEKTVIKPVEDITEELIDSLGLVSDGKGGFDFSESVRKMMSEKGIIMGDTITLGKYQDLMPERNENGEIPNSYLIVDEADAELLDTQPQEILGATYEGRVADERWEDRKKAREAIEQFEGTPQDLEEYAKKVGISLDFIVDAYEAKGFEEKDEDGAPINYSVKDGKIFILNPNTNVMIPASQGLSQAIIANDSELSEKHSDFPEMEVLGETDIPKLFSNFEKASLMSGTMQDKGMSDRASKEQIDAYVAARKVFLTRCGNGVQASSLRGVIDWKLVTPQTRTERGNAVVNLNGLVRSGEKDSEISTYETTESISNWKEYLELNGDQIDEKWQEAVQTEASIRSNEGQPVMVSVYGGRDPMNGTVPVYTDKNQIGSKENGSEDHKIGDDTCMFVDDGKGEIACFDDFYGRGYTFKFIDRKDGEVVKNTKGKPQKTDKGGHVLITSLPQNSRNLEQFLFRVARGGDKGSSSIIISPTDPVLTGYLEKIQADKGIEAANEYFEGVLSGKIDVMQMVVDIYPEQTQDLFYEKASQIDATRFYENGLNVELEHIRAVMDKGKAKTSDEGLKAFEEAYRKEMLKQCKFNRQVGIEEEELPDQQIDMVKNAIKNSKMKNPIEILAVLPKGLSEEELEGIIFDENTRKSVIELSGKVDRYIETRKGKTIDDTGKTETETKTRTMDEETYEATTEDPEYNFESVKDALAAIREMRGLDQRGHQNPENVQQNPENTDPER